MTLRHMKIFVSVFQHSNITKAANELHLTQPSVSFAIKELEEYYGIRLFERIGRRISPSESGKEFYEYALHIVSLFDEMEQKIKNWDTLGTLRIGTSITIGTHILPTLVSQYQKTCPKLRIEAVVNKSATIIQLLLDNAIDIGLIETQPDDADILAIPFMKDTLCAIVPPDSPLSTQPRTSLSQLSEYPFLMREKGSAGREILDAYFALQQITVKPVWESSSTQAIVSGVAKGLGVAVLPFLLVKADIESGNVIQVPLEEPLQRNLNIIYHKSKYLTENMKSFITLCEHYSRKC